MECDCGTVFCNDDADLILLCGQKQVYCSKACKRKARRKREAALREQQSQEKRLAVCRKRGKVPYLNVALARAAASRQFLQRGQLLYPYLCPCGWLHLTKEPQLVPGDWEWFRVTEVDSPAFKVWLSREAALSG